MDAAVPGNLNFQDLSVPQQPRAHMARRSRVRADAGYCAWRGAGWACWQPCFVSVRHGLCHSPACERTIPTAGRAVLDTACRQDTMTIRRNFDADVSLNPCCASKGGKAAPAPLNHGLGTALIGLKAFRPQRPSAEPPYVVVPLKYAGNQFPFAAAAGLGPNLTSSQPPGQTTLPQQQSSSNSVLPLPRVPEMTHSRGGHFVRFSI